MNKEELNKESATLIPCPFCSGKAEFHMSKNNKAPLHIHHYPEPGMVCPARMDQVCDSFEQGRRWWNTRAK